jgi:hypothetical protein
MQIPSPLYYYTCMRAPLFRVSSDRPQQQVCLTTTMSLCYQHFGSNIIATTFVDFVKLLLLHSVIVYNVINTNY